MNKLIAAFSLLALLTVPQLSLAQTNETGSVVSTGICLEHIPLTYRSLDSNTGGEVSLLQDFLLDRGFLKDSTGAPYTGPLGFYGMQTIRAVKAYQVSKGISPLGYVGPATRNAITADSGYVGACPPGDTSFVGPVTTSCAGGYTYSTTLHTCVANATIGNVNCTTDPTNVSCNTLYYCSGGVVSHDPCTTSGTSQQTVNNLVIQKLATDVGISTASITLIDSQPMTWNDGCLGIPPTAAMVYCTQGVVPGYKVTLRANYLTYIYHTNSTGSSIMLYSSGLAVATPTVTITNSSANSLNASYTNLPTSSYAVIVNKGTGAITISSGNYLSGSGTFQMNYTIGAGTYAVRIISYTTGAQLAESASFTVGSTATLPEITSFNPSSAPTGVPITINGSRFTTNGNKVYMDYTDTSWYVVASNVSSSGTSLTFTLPTELPCPTYASTAVGCPAPAPVTPGTHTFRVLNSNNQLSNAMSFTVTAPTTCPYGQVPMYSGGCGSCPSTSTYSNGTCVNITNPYTCPNGTVVQVGLGVPPYLYNEMYCMTAASAPSFTTSSLPSATVGTSYNTTISSTGGGTGTRSWFISLGSLPAGLSLNSASCSASCGAIVGTPTTAGTYTFTVTMNIAASAGVSATSLSQQFTIVVNAAAVTTTPTVSVTSSNSTSVSVSYTNVPANSQAVVVNKGTGALVSGANKYFSTASSAGTFSISGITLIPGNYAVRLINYATGATLTESGTFSIDYLMVAAPTVTVTSSNPNSVTLAFANMPGNSEARILNAATNAQVVNAFAMLTGIASQPQTQPLYYTFSGLNLSAGSYKIRVVNDSTEAMVVESAPFTISGTATSYTAPSFTTSSIPSATVGTSYSTTIGSTGGGTGTRSWFISIGSLPAGLSLNSTSCSTSCAIVGTPTTAGTYTFTVTMNIAATTGVAATSLSQQFTMVVNSNTVDIPAITSAELAQGWYYGDANQKKPGTPSTWVLVDSGTRNAMWKAPAATTAYSSPVFTTYSLPSATIGTSYNASISTTGGAPTARRTWFISSTAQLPPGLSLTPGSCTSSPCNAAIVGTPTTAGSYTFTVTTGFDATTGASASSLSQQFTIVVGGGTSACTSTQSLVNGVCTTTTVSYSSPIFTTYSLPAGTAGTSYNAPITTSGGAPSARRTWFIYSTAANAQLPLGLSFSTTVCSSSPCNTAIVGTPTTAGTYNFTVTTGFDATSESTALSLSQQFTIVVNQAAAAALGSYRGYLDGSQTASIATDNLSQANALANCTTYRNSNPTTSIRCTWNGTEIYSYTAPSCPSGQTFISGACSPATATYMGYRPGNTTPYHTMVNVTREFALSTCMTNSGAGIRCTWNGVEIFNNLPAIVTPVITSVTPSSALGAATFTLEGTGFSASNTVFLDYVSTTSPGTVVGSYGSAGTTIGAFALPYGASLAAGTHTLTVKNGTGGVSLAKQFTILPPPPAAPAITFTSTAAAVPAGSKATLTWSTNPSTNVTCQATGGDGVGWIDVPSNYTWETPALYTTTNYGIGCTNNSNNLKSYKYVSIYVPIQISDANAPVITLTSAANQNVSLGGSATLTWSVSPTTNVSCVAAGGEIPPGYVIPTTGTWTSSKLNVSTQYVLRCENTVTHLIGYKYINVTVPLQSNAGGSSSFALGSTGTVLGAATVCVDLPYNFHRGYESKVVSKMQTFLISQGLLSGEPTGFFGDKTLEAVKSYQKSRGLPQTGMVYGMTRAAIKADTCK